MVDRFPIGEKQDPQATALGFGNPSPAADATVSLDEFFDGAVNGSFNPLVADRGARVWPVIYKLR